MSSVASLSNGISQVSKWWSDIAMKWERREEYVATWLVTSTEILVSPIVL